MPARESRTLGRAASTFERTRADHYSIPHGPDVEPYVEAAQKAIDAGFDHVVLLGAGSDQAGFIRFFEQTLAPELRGLKAKAQSGGKAQAAAKASRGKSRSAAKKR